MTYRFVCTNCGKKFELDSPDAKECPFCYWSSSVKREDLHTSEKKNKVLFSREAGIESKKAEQKSLLKIFPYLFRALILLILIVGVGVLGYKVYPFAVSAIAKRAQTISIRVSQEKKPSSKDTKNNDSSPLSAQEKEILYHEAVVEANRVPDQAEQEILNRIVQFQTGWSENLPSVVWTLPQYQKVIGEQEQFYKMPFSHSYKGKLEDLFKKKYLAAAEAFTKGDVLAARNLWMESLAFPLYSTDLRKHRAVALTMLRPFINDTLAKIRAMNQSLSEKEQRAEEQTLNGQYQNLTNLIAQKKWQEAIDAINKLIPFAAELQKKAKGSHLIPSYPMSFGGIDQDLQRPLMDLMAANPSSLADLHPLQQDLVEKKEVLTTFTEAYVKDATENYRDALELIHQKKWQEAIRILDAIQGPRVLQEDAAQKVAILKQQIPPMLDSPDKTS